MATLTPEERLDWQIKFLDAIIANCQYEQRQKAELEKKSRITRTKLLKKRALLLSKKEKK